MKCNSYGSEWTAGSAVSGEIQTYPFCVKALGVWDITPSDEY